MTDEATEFSYMSKQNTMMMPIVYSTPKVKTSSKIVLFWMMESGS